MMDSPRYLVTLTFLALLTTVPSTLLVTLRTGGWTLLIAVVETTVFPHSIRLVVVLAGVEPVDVPLALPPSDNNSSMAIIAVVAEAEPVVMSPMKLGRTLTSLLSTLPLPT